MMDLPMVNGASEGTLSVALFLSLSAIFGIEKKINNANRNRLLGLRNIWD